MAKKIKIGLAVYTLNNKYCSEVRCTGCECIIKQPHRAYSAIKYDNPKNYYCLACLNKMKIDFQEQSKQRAFAYPKQKKLYIGSNHKCGEKIDDFAYRLAYFQIGRSARLLPLRQCKQCKEYFMILSDAKKNAYILQPYTLINPQTKKQIYIPYYPKNMVSPKPYSNQGKLVEATPREQWAARHPYQGGSCSGK